MKKNMAKVCLIAAAMLFMLMSSSAMAAKKEKAPEPMPPTGNLDLSDALEQTLTVKVDGEELKVQEYIDVYIPNPSITDQKVTVYVPEGATEDSPIILCVNNSGWMANSYSARTKIAKDNPNEIAEYISTDDKDRMGAMLARRFVVVSYGCRSRNGEPTAEGLYDGHSPATVTDTKAVIRYLRHNASVLPAGDVEKIIITGTSGGGALSAVVAASGNSSDFFESLYAIGAAGIEKQADGKLISTLGDHVYGVIAYCPITDLGNADAAYEWTFKDARMKLEGIDFGNGKKSNVYYSTEGGTLNPEVSDLLAAQYEAYVDGLGLVLDDGTPLTRANLKDAIAGLMRDEIEESLREIGAEQMMADIEKGAEPKNWLTLNADGTYEYDYDGHVTHVAASKKLKVVSAFSNAGLPWAATNEDSLFGAPEFEYCAFSPYAWDNDGVAGNGCGIDDTGMVWDSFMQTEAGMSLRRQIRMSNAIEYLNDHSGSDAAGQKAPHWYIRYGMNDRDSSFAVETILRYSLYNNPEIKTKDFEFAWFMPHMGDYDVQEAYTWLDEVLSAQ